MGLFWDLMQQSALSDQCHGLRTLEERVGQLEAELRQTREVLFEALLRTLELTSSRRSQE